MIENILIFCVKCCCCISYDFVLQFIAVHSVNSRVPHGRLACILLNVQHSENKDDYNYYYYIVIASSQQTI